MGGFPVSSLFAHVQDVSAKRSITLPSYQVSAVSGCNAVRTTPLA